MAQFDNACVPGVFIARKGAVALDMGSSARSRAMLLASEHDMRPALTRLSLLEGAGMRKRLKINLRLAKVCSHFPTLLLP